MSGAVPPDAAGAVAAAATPVIPRGAGRIDAKHVAAGDAHALALTREGEARPLFLFLFLFLFLLHLSSALAPSDPLQTHSRPP
eukprot:2650722-Pyramimonas_sp.AAC.1